MSLQPAGFWNINIECLKGLFSEFFELSNKYGLYVVENFIGLNGILNWKVYILI